MKEYTRPRVEEYGSVEDITQEINKIGHKEDMYTEATGGDVIGSTIPV